MNNEKKAVGFDPRTLIQEVADKTGKTALTLDLKHKKTWFRLACPNGGVVLNPLRVTDQMAIFEARLFADKDDRNPIASFTAIRAADKSIGRQYIQSAQDAALNEALDNAGFGPEFCGLTLAEGLPQPRSATAAPQEKQENAAPAEKADFSPVPPVETDTPSVPSADARKHDAPPVVVPKRDSVPVQRPVQEREGTPLTTLASSADVHSAPVDPQPQGTAVNASAAQKGAPLSVVNIAGRQSVTADTISGTQPGIASREAASAPDSQPEKVQVDTQSKAEETAVEFTADMDVEKIHQLMTMERARSILAPSGIRKGWTLGQVEDEAPASLKWYRFVCPDADNITKAACQLLLDDLNQREALKKAG